MMRRIARVLVALLAICAGGDPADVRAADAAVAAVGESTALDRYLAGLTTWTATFSESVVDARGKSIGRGEGSLTIVRPGRFRWELSPQAADQGGQLLVADGRNLWFLDRDLDQVTVKPLDVALSQTPAMLLSGTSSMRESFDISSAGRSEGLDWVRAVPRQKDADFRVARFGFLGTDLRRMVLEDKLGQKVTLVFASSLRNRPVDPARVSFVPPPGVDVIGVPAK
jgi:outer membrane lipoprotein carrier protein